jgi:hypothetical protein
MLDAYIIERIRREKALEEQRNPALVPLRIEIPPDLSEEIPLPPPRRDKDSGRGSTEIDFNI